ncbi:unnamed protein product [Meganyctiphanes norvegica]|uniref:Ion transport domain-containing protein n=1 Tax=Meganyctiphanes norvegica TaxID=48144 RepID=A0AAV2QT52_MEGNR
MPEYKVQHYQELSSISSMEAGKKRYGSFQNLTSASDNDNNNSLVQELLSVVKHGNVERLKRLLPDSPTSGVGRQELNHVYPAPVQGTLLHIAAKENMPQVARKLIDHGADPNIRDHTDQKYCPIHYATEEGYHQVVQVLLDGKANPSAREGLFGRSPLHILPKSWKKSKSGKNDFKQCLDLLLDNNQVNVDSQDDNQATPLFLACKVGWEYMVEKLVLKGANLQYVGRNNITGAQHIAEVFPELLDNVQKSDKLADIKKPRFFGDELLDEGLKNNDIETFKQILSDIEKTEDVDKSAIIEEDYGKTLLQYACNNGQTEFVEELISHGADPLNNDKTNLNSPILYSTWKGYYKIVEILVESMDQNGKVKEGLEQVDTKEETALHKVVKKECKMEEDGRDYKECFDVLMRYKDNINMDATDEDGNTALHYAVLWDDQSFVRHLLFNGAHWGIRNEAGTIAITNIKANVLEEILNDCIKLQNQNLDFREFEVVLNYCMLVPATNSVKPETERLTYLSNSRAHQHLLCHPIINTFLFLKWQRIRLYYYFNMFAYTIYLCLLTTYILLFHGTVIESESSANNLNSTQSINSTSTAPTVQDPILPARDFNENLLVKIPLQVLISIFTFYIALRETVQFCVSWRLYIARIENWLEISIVFMTIALFIPISPHAHQSLAAWLILFTWIEFVLLLGCHPALAVYITMFTKVAYNFLKFILMFSFMILAFSLSFYLVFQMNEQFTTYHQSLLRTFAMSTGELEYTELPLSAFPVSSHILFILFIFLIVLVLMNLLNGLAVSDIVQIQKEAEIVSYKSRVELISYLESVFVVGSCPLTKFGGGSGSCCAANYDNFVVNLLGPKTLMLRDCLKNQCIKMFPNRAKGKCWEICDCHSSKLEKSHIDSAMSIVLGNSLGIADSLTELKNHMANMDEAMSMLKDQNTNMDTAMATMEKAISNLTEMVQKHVLCPTSPPAASRPQKSADKKLTLVQ